MATPKLKFVALRCLAFRSKDLIPEEGTQKLKEIQVCDDFADVAIPAGIVQFALLITVYCCHSF